MLRLGKRMATTRKELVNKHSSKEDMEKELTELGF